MNQQKQKKSLCFLLIICMLFLGMCIETIQADSFFSYESSAHAASALLSGERTTLTTQEYPAENIAKDECFTDLYQVIRRSFGHHNKGIALSLLCVDTLPQIFPFIQTSSDCELTAESSSRTVIVTYIHNQDGQKA